MELPKLEELAELTPSQAAALLAILETAPKEPTEIKSEHGPVKQITEVKKSVICRHCGTHDEKHIILHKGEWHQVILEDDRVGWHPYLGNFKPLP